MQQVPEPCIRLESRRVVQKERWKAYVKDLTKQRLTRQRLAKVKMDCICAEYILGGVCEQSSAVGDARY